MIQTYNSQLTIMHYELWIVFGRSGYRRRAFRYIFFRLRFRLRLQKDAAPIPNALEATISKAHVKQTTPNSTFLTPNS